MPLPRFVPWPDGRSAGGPSLGATDTTLDQAASEDALATGKQRAATTTEGTERSERALHQGQWHSINATE